jgi:hypothetical protein
MQGPRTESCIEERVSVHYISTEYRTKKSVNASGVRA